MATKELAKVQKNITDNVLAKVKQFQANGDLVLPKDYQPSNALKSAYLILQETVDRSKRPVLESCSQTSIANTLLDMVTQGLNPAKKQCYFIPYGNKLTMIRSYMGAIALARRVAGLIDIKANVVYEGDEFEYEIDVNSGRKLITKHTSKLENIDNNKIVGVYAIYRLNDGTVDAEIMTMQQVRVSWMKSVTKGNGSVHKEYPDQMAKRTVINRTCKILINTSTDGNLAVDDFEHNPNEVIEGEYEDMDFTQEVIDVEAPEVVDEATGEIIEEDIPQVPEEPTF